MSDNDLSYRLFTTINYKQFRAGIYLTRIVAIVNKLYENIQNIDARNTFKGTDEEIKDLEVDINVLTYLFKRRAVDAINIHFNAITDVLVKNNEDYTLVESMYDMCEDIKSNISRTIVRIDEKTVHQLCNKKYKVFYGAIQNNLVEDYAEARYSLMALVDSLQNGDEVVQDIFGFLNNR